MYATPDSGRQRLVRFRLADIPLDIRLRAARALANRHRATPQDASPAELLLARLRSDHWDAQAETDTSTYEGLKRVAEHPSDRVYRVSEEAFLAVVGRLP